MDTVHKIGRRKTAVARIYLSEGKGNITVNKKDFKDYFPTGKSRSFIYVCFSFYAFRNAFRRCFLL